MAEGADDEDRTEEPTQRKLDEAIKHGDVPRSQEVTTLFMLAAFTLALMMTARGSGREFTSGMRAFLAAPHLVPDGNAGMILVAKRALSVMFSTLVMPVGIMMVAAIAAGLVQHPPLWTAEPLLPKASRLSPLENGKRIFGKQGALQFVKGLAKITIVGTAASLVLWNERGELQGFAALAPVMIGNTLLSLSLKLLAATLAVYAVVAIGDGVYQRISWHNRQRMSKQEIKQESKEQNGNPELKAHIRKLGSQLVRKRMMAAVPKATVVIANPTHFAVVLKYEPGMPAPICVAKGVDALALRIRLVAREHDVPVIENPPLARTLHAVVEVDGEIPVEHYKAVAEVIGFVLRLKRRAA